MIQITHLNPVPCAFCGTIPIQVKHCAVFFVVCAKDECSAEGPGADSVERAVDNWAKRDGKISRCCEGSMIPPDTELADNMGTLAKAFDCWICRICSEPSMPIDSSVRTGAESS